MLTRIRTTRHTRDCVTPLWGLSTTDTVVSINIKRSSFIPCMSLIIKFDRHQTCIPPSPSEPGISPARNTNI